MVDAPPADTADLNLLREWREPLTGRRLLQDAFGSVVVHIVLISAIVLMSSGELPVQETPGVQVSIKTSTPLYIPRVFEPTQKDPNKGPVTRGLDLRSATEGRPTPTRRFRPPTPAPGVPAPAQASAPALEAPKIDVASGAPMAPTIGVGAPSAGPPPPQERPKLALESVTGGTSPKPNPNPDVKLDLPKPTPQVARLTPKPGGGGVTVGDIGEVAPPLTGAPAPAPCQECSSLQLLSDPQNVDFKPYLQQVLALVKRNWLSVIPESARLGRRGVVLLQFSIDRRGLVPKVVIATPSGIEAFDRAAVAGLSMSNPLPPLPAQYKGDQVRLQMAFSYNIASQR
jgi:TonB family protein